MDLYSQEIQEKQKDLQNQPQTIKKMAKGTYVSIITLNVNGLMLQAKDTDWLNGYKNKTHIYVGLQETYFRPKNTYRLKVRGWKIYSMKMQSKRKLE